MSSQDAQQQQQGQPTAAQPRALSRQKKWPIKVVETYVTRPPAFPAAFLF
jgi:hypothetical protein